MGKIIAAHAVVLLEVADDGLDGRSPSYVAFDLWGDAALLASGVDLELIFGRGFVAAVSGIGDDAIECVAEDRLHGGDDGGGGGAGIPGYGRGHTGGGETGRRASAAGASPRSPSRRTHRACVLFPCRCIPPRSHAGCKSCGRAGGGPAPARARPDTAAAPTFPLSPRRRPFCGECRG